MYDGKTESYQEYCGDDRISYALYLVHRESSLNYPNGLVAPDDPKERQNFWDAHEADWYSILDRHIEYYENEGLKESANELRKYDFRR